MKGIKHVYFFASFNVQGISTRYRGVHVLQALKKYHEIPSTFIYPGYKWNEVARFMWAYLCVLFSVGQGNVVIYQKLYSKGIYTRMLKLLVRLRPKGTIYDTDDADYLRCYEENIYFFMQKCEMCSVGSVALKEFTKKYNENVLLLTSPVLEHAEVKVDRNQLFHIGWVGDYGLNNGYVFPFSHKISLNDILFPVLKELEFEFKLTVLGIKNPEDKSEIERFFEGCGHIELDVPMDVDWLDEIAIYRQIKAFDVGVSPMLYHEFNVAKSAFKAKQYLSCGVPVLASPIGENTAFVKDGVNGFLCKDSDAFKQRLIQMYKMTDEQYWALSKQTLLNYNEYSMKGYCEKLIQGINRLDPSVGSLVNQISNE